MCFYMRLRHAVLFVDCAKHDVRIAARRPRSTREMIEKFSMQYPLRLCGGLRSERQIWSTSGRVGHLTMIFPTIYGCSPQK
jgi:hypothetical protein